LVRKFFDGSVINSEVKLSTHNIDGNNVELRYNAVRGMYYKVHSATNVEGPYSDGGGVGQLATEASIGNTNAPGGAQKFFQVSASLTP